MHLPFSVLTLLSASAQIPRDLEATAAVAATNCSVKGYDKGPHPAFLLNTTITAPAACKTFCTNATPKCTSFAVGTPGCLLYNVAVDGNVNAMNGSAYTFYDAACTV